MGESRALCSVESATRSCFQGVSATQMPLGVGHQGTLQNHHSTGQPANLMEEVGLAFGFSRNEHSQHRSRKEPGTMRVHSSSILETKVTSRNTSTCAAVFQVLSPAIKEERFLSWLQSEPPILLWLPTCYRLSATEMATHPARCGICRNFPITGLRYSRSSVTHGQ